MISFAIHLNRIDIYQEFQKQIDLLEQQKHNPKSVSINIGKGTIKVEKEDIAKQTVNILYVLENFLFQSFNRLMLLLEVHHQKI